MHFNGAVDDAFGYLMVVVHSLLNCIRNATGFLAQYQPLSITVIRFCDLFRHGGLKELLRAFVPSWPGGFAQFFTQA
jgi:hypothetical protein